MNHRKQQTNKSKSPIPISKTTPTVADIEKDLRGISREIYALEDSLLQSRIARDYVSAEMKERELISLRGFFRDKEEDLKELDRDQLNIAVSKKMEDKYGKANNVWDEKMKIFEDHVSELQDDLIMHHDSQIDAKLNELELLLPKEVQTNHEIALLRKKESTAAKIKEYFTFMKLC